MQITPYLTFNGQCETAFKFYEKVLGGKVAMKTTYGDMPMCQDMPREMREKVAHIRLVTGDAVLMGCDAGEHYDKPQGMSVTLGIDTVEEAERIFSALAENGAIRMPIAETFWADRFGVLVDQYGTPWMINCEKKQWHKE